MGQFSRQIEDLLSGKTVRFRPRGNSMTGTVDDGDLVEVSPLREPPQKGDVVLCKVRGVQYLHLVSAVRGDQFQISNARGRINGWIGLPSVFGRMTRRNPTD